MRMTRIVMAAALLTLGDAGSHAGALTDALYASNFEAPPDCSSIGAPGCPGFTMEIPVGLAAGEVAAYCYYFRTPNSGTLGVGRFSSRFDAFTAHIIVWTTVDATTGAVSDRQPPGTLSSTDCGFAAANNNNTVAHRIYSAHATTEALRMPGDDGAGTPLAVELPANAAGFVEMYFTNPSLNPVSALVTFAANGLAAGASYTKTATYMTYNASISIPPASSNVTFSYSCDLPASVKFWWFSTHTHHFAASATLSNGATTILSTNDWESPTIQTYAGPGFYVFGGSEKLTYSCTYNNPGFGTVQSGDDYANDENCVGIGYFFPADLPKICYNAGPL